MFRRWLYVLCGVFALSLLLLVSAPLAGARSEVLELLAESAVATVLVAAVSVTARYLVRGKWLE